MDAKELRIGNKLQKSNGEIFTVSRLEDSLDILVKEKPGLLTLDYNLLGVPLTEEILIMSGFEKVSTVMHNRFILDNGAFFFELLGQEQEGSYHLKISNSLESAKVGCGIFKYLHNLQNICSDFQTELQINL